MLQNVLQIFKIFQFHLNAIIVCMCLCINGLGCLICTGPFEFSHNSPQVSRICQHGGCMVAPLVGCVWSDGPTWDLISNRPAQAGWASVLHAHCGTPPGV